MPFSLTAVELCIVTINEKARGLAKRLTKIRHLFTYEIVFSSQQPKAKDFRRHCCNVLFPHLRQWLTKKIQEDHQQAIEEKDNQIQPLEFTNEKNQPKILRLNKEIDDLIKNRHVARRRGCFDNVLRELLETLLDVTI